MAASRGRKPTQARGQRSRVGQARNSRTPQLEARSKRCQNLSDHIFRSLTGAARMEIRPSASPEFLTAEAGRRREEICFPLRFCASAVILVTSSKMWLRSKETVKRAAGRL